MTHDYIVLININIKTSHYAENIGGTITSIIDLGSVVQRFKGSKVHRWGKIISSGKKNWNLCYFYLHRFVSSLYDMLKAMFASITMTLIF
jgi:hypothetical protein